MSGRGRESPPHKHSRILRRAVAIARDTGMRGLWFAVLSELGYRRLAIRECILDKPFPGNGARVPVALELLDDTRIDEYNAFRSDVDPDSARRRLAAGDKCFVARRDGSIVSALWVATAHARCNYLSRGIPLADDEAYMYDVFTAPEWRGKGVFPALTSEMHRFYQKSGKRRSICFTVPENKPAMIANTGYRKIGIIGYVGIGGLRHHFCRLDRGEQAPGKHDRPISE